MSTPTRIFACFALALGATHAFALNPEDVYCDRTHPLSPVQVFSMGARRCASGEVVEDSGMCVYNLPCVVLTDEHRRRARERFGAEWSALTDQQREEFFSGDTIDDDSETGTIPDTGVDDSDWVHTTLTCAGGTAPASDASPTAVGTCPPPDACMRDVYVGVHLARFSDRTRFTSPIFRAAPPSSGAAASPAGETP